MHLKSLVLKGFKSFADRSVMNFEPGITAIVGPNGSGKSNVSDSVLWVLGERNAKNLRGQAMEDVIFAGSSARKPVSVAEVDLILDNTDGTLPVEYTEVAITRRMYRNGESEYLINGTPARRMDVLDILHDTGMGTGTHSIIAQGHLSSILQSKPEDRRTLIEEAAGVLKHKQRKQKSERKLEQMDVHLSRVTDIVAEVERQVRPLERKAKRALQYKDLAAELAELSLTLAVDDLRILQKTWDEIIEREKELGNNIESLRTEISTAEALAEELQLKLQTQSEDAGAVAVQYRRAGAAADRLDAQILLLHEKKRSAQNYLAEMNVSADGDASVATELETRRAEAEAAARAASGEAEAAQAALDTEQAHYDELEAQRTELQTSLDSVIQARRESLNELEAVRAKQAATQEVLAENRANEQLLGTHAAQIEEQMLGLFSTLSGAKDSHGATQAELAEARTAAEDARNALSKAFTSRDAARTRMDQLREERVVHSAEVLSLEELERTRRDANGLLSWVLDNEDVLGAKLGSFINEIKVPRELESVVDALLGRDVAALFVQDTDAAVSLVQRLATVDESGSVTLLPRTGMRRAQAAVTGAPLLIDSLTIAPQAQEVAQALLGDVALFDSPAEAISFVRSHPGACAATRDATIVWPNGKITRTHASGEEVGGLSGKRSLDEARDALAKTEQQFEEASNEYARCEEELRTAQAESLKATQRQAELQGAADSATAELDRAQSAYDALLSEQQQLAEEVARARAALEAAEPDAAELTRRHEELSRAVDAGKEAMDEKRAALAPLNDEVAVSAAKLADLRVRAATAKERSDYADRVLSARVQDIASAHEAEARRRAGIERRKAVMQRIDPVIATLESLVRSAQNCAKKLEEQTADSQNSSVGLHARINEARGNARTAHEAYDAANGQLADVRVEKGRLEMQVEAAIQTITEDCDTPLETALELPELENRPEIEEQAFKLQRRIKNMGTINPDAAAEYEALKARYDYLVAQLADMQAARRSIAKIVRVIDARMKDDFVQTFDTVKENYQEIISILFPGGSGELTLVDPDDPENTGVEVSAQPLGKRFLKMSLMSGGEQSLVALALLFAVYKTRATPFYILDEVEAALDDTNLRRLCAYLDSMRHDTQFIMITHQRRTMEMADVLYGISMQSDGVTKVMSQRLDRALEMAEN
ncbi:MAG: chromosome segregation protein SMC [Eggerthellaceae bacterium]|nr:chromosome segregation protein SMC [Eggerthellaceae bacterium]